MPDPAWLDAGPVDPGWSAPASLPPPTPPTSTRRLAPGLAYAVVAVALVVLVAGVWGFGGLKKRHDLQTEIAPGTTVSTGPYELAFSEVTVQRTKDFDDTIYWKVTAIGSGRNTGSGTRAPKRDGDYGMFVAKDSASGEIETPTGTDFGSADSDRTAFAPGLAPIPYGVTFSFKEGYQPGDTLIFAVYDLEFSDTSLLGDDDPSWHNGSHAWFYRLPVRVLADDTD